MKYKPSDKVRIKSLDWYNENKNENGYIDCGNARFIPTMSTYCGEVLTICGIEEEFSYYHMKECQYVFMDEMIEGLVEEEVFIKANDIYNEEYSKGEYCHEQSFKWGFQEGYNYSHENDKLEISLKEDYQFVDENGNVINAKKIVLEKKKKEYPKTYEECYKIMGVKLSDCYIQGYKSPLLEDLQELLICRDAYWKIAGEEMGLGKPWEPDWTTDDVKHSLVNVGNTIILSVECKVGRILAFPSKEMRDTFYENFKELIESLKELL